MSLVRVCSPFWGADSKPRVCVGADEKSAGTFDRPFDRYAARSSGPARATNGASPGARKRYNGFLMRSVDGRAERGGSQVNAHKKQI
jgi:hypothetical protein